jgi:hypothetical protein
MLAAMGIVLAASGCLGGATAPASRPVPPPLVAGLPPQPYAVFHIRAAYTTTGGRTNHFGGDVHLARFTLACESQRYYAGHYGRVSWRSRLCIALLDYRTRTPLQGTPCRCPVSRAGVDVRGTIRGRPIREHFTPCLCGYSPRQAADVRIILGTHPKVPAT